MNELTVILKDEERTLRKKFVVYEPYTVSLDDPFIKKCVETTLEEFKGDADSIQVKIHMELK